MLSILVQLLLVAFPATTSARGYTFHQKHWNERIEAEIKWNTPNGGPPLLIARRGESFLVPELTIPSFELACHLGADFVNIELMMTKDGQLVTYHDRSLKAATNVADHPEFTHVGHMGPDGKPDWDLHDFTLEQLKTLGFRSKPYGIGCEAIHCLSIPTFEEFVTTMHRLSFQLNREFGLMVELKHPDDHNEVDGPGYMQRQLIDSLRAMGYPIRKGDPENCTASVGGVTHPIACPPIIIHMSDIETVRYLSTQTDLPLMYLAKDPEHLTYKGMEELAQFVHYLAVWKEIVVFGPELDVRYRNMTWDAEKIQSLGGFVKAEEIPALVRKLGMGLFIETIHDSREYSTRSCLSECGLYLCKEEETGFYLDLGVDGVLMDNIVESKNAIVRYGRRQVMHELTGDVRWGWDHSRKAPRCERYGPERSGWCQEVGYCAAYQQTM